MSTLRAEPGWADVLQDNAAELYKIPLPVGASS